MIMDDDILRRAAMPLRVACLDTAIQLTAGDRNAAYGEPVPNHQQIADIFAAITGHRLTARDVALLHVATKLARLSGNALHQDSYIDAMAYLGIAYECAVEGPAPMADAEVDELLGVKREGRT